MSQVVEHATKEDGDEILKIIESSSAKGKMELLYTRRPNAVDSYNKESNDVEILAIKEDGKINGTLVNIVRNVYIDGKPQKAGYYCGLKRNGDYKGNIRWIKIIKNCCREDIDYCFCSILLDNHDTQKMFEKKRKNTVNMSFLRTYRTYMFSTEISLKSMNSNEYSFKRASLEDEPSIIKFLNEEGSKKDLFPVIKSISQFTDLKITDFYMLTQNNEIISVGALWNQLNYRQYVVKKYHGILKYAHLLNPIIKKLGYIELPSEDKIVEFPMLSFCICKNDEKDYYKAFLYNIVKEIKRENNMFVIGTFDKSPLDNILGSLKNIHFDSQICSVDFLSLNKKSPDINKERLWLECGLL